MRSKWSNTPAAFTSRNCSSTLGGCRGTPCAPRPLQPSEMPSSIDQRLRQTRGRAGLLLDVQLLLEGVQVARDPPCRERRVAPGERIDDLAVLVSAAVRGARAPVRKAEERRAADEVLHEPVERGVAGELGQKLVKPDREALAGPAVAAVVGLLLVDDEGAQLRELLHADAAGEPLHHRGFDHAPRLEHVARLVRRWVGDDRAAVRAQLDEQAVTQSRQRRAYRAAA